MRFLNLLELSMEKSDGTLNFFRQNIMVIKLYIALVQEFVSVPLKLCLSTTLSINGCEFQTGRFLNGYIFFF